ncbi:DnaB-like helicase C-terminal domain-containing protein [Clostridium perfringens]|nr:DnaB-like helicase C-terminal domain-containing protein [Clostridium perfringens]MDK0850259.1 DnaB-like helicase C-terminal domain-containing protein [Clostridium perfringens]MDM0743542.1 DnaB-like helicase C-terminal domain-containing protein [Clostridium perfringens]
MRNLNEMLKNISIVDYVRDNGLGQVIQVGTNNGTASVYRVVPCPICGGKQDLTIYRSANGEETFSSFDNCCTGGTIADFISSVDNIKINDAIKEALKFGGFNNSNLKDVELSDYVFKDELTKQEKLNRDIILNCRIPSSANAYYFSRGIKEPLIDKYKLGYHDEGYNHFVSNIDPEMKNKFKYASIYKYILPVMDMCGNVISFISRVDEEALRNLREEIGYEQEIKKAFNAKTLEMPILNEKYISCMGSISLEDNYIPYTDNKLIFITEGYFDALSFEACGYHAVSLNTANNTKKLIKLIRDNYDYIKKYTIVLAMDSDTKGLKATRFIKNALDDLNLIIKEFDMKGYKDANEFYVNDSSEFIDTIINTCKSVEFNSVSYFMMNKFMNKAKKKASLGVIPTGLKALDNIMGGGLYAEELTVVAAESSLGKTTLAVNIANNVSEKGNDALYFAVEQGEFDLSAKLLSRFSFVRNIGSKSLKDAMSNPDSYTARRLAYLDGIAEHNLQELLFLYSESSASKNLYIREQNMTMTLDYIKDEIKLFIKTTGRTPVVVIDYLQNIDTDDVRMNDKQKVDKSMRELKILARELTLPMIVISSVNRGSYTSRLTFSSLKESGSIEFTADNVIALNLSAIDEISNLPNEAEKKKKYQEVKGAPIREIDADILKQRNGDIGVTAKLAFVPAFNYYTSL